MESNKDGKIIVTEICYKCGGWGGEPGENFGDRGFHPCFKCGESGRLPLGTYEQDMKLAQAELELERERQQYFSQEMYD